MERKTVHIVVIGGGFGGLTFCQHFKHPDARITIVDKHNHHLFQPLLYQVATAGLSAPEIAQPIRSILSGRENITVLLDEVRDLNLAAKEVVLSERTLSYDYLVLAAGGRTTYFGHPEWEQFAPGLKSLEDAIRIRRNVLLAFEHAENETDPAERARLMTIVVVGGGPTGVELAGAFSELARQVLRRDFRHIDPANAQIFLIEASPRVLSNMDEDLQVSATEQLQKMGVHILGNTKVANITPDGVELHDGQKIRAANVIWAAGVGASPLGQKLGAELDRAGRVKVNPDLSVPGHPEVFVLGDMVSLLQKNGKPVPGVSPAAMQMANHAARIIENELTSPGIATRPAFDYFDKGTMATIGRSAAVAQAGPFKFSGYLAWLAWLFIHLIFLVGFRNQIAVLWQWLYSYLTYKRGSRIITDVAPIAPASTTSRDS